MTGGEYGAGDKHCKSERGGCSLGCSACVKTARVTPAKREARLKEAKELFEKGLIHLRDYDQKKAEILSSL